jgi:hypothetical protein
MSCEYPFELDEISNKCISFGIIEISNTVYTFEDIEEYAEIRINRYYESFSKVGVFYRLINTGDDENYSKIENTKGILIFENGENTKIIRLNIFRSFLNYDKMNKYILEIFNPFGGCYIGKIEKTEIEIFEKTAKYFNLNSIKRDIFLIDDKKKQIIENYLIKMY